MTHDDIVPGLFVEFFQTETSAAAHPREEAERLGDVPPGKAMRAVSEHAARTLPQLRELAARERLETTTPGAALGRLFSAVRSAVTDPFTSREMSYRGTLLGMHHGVDLALLLRSAALASGRHSVTAFCDAWLAERRRLVDDVEVALAWFGANPEVASQRALPRPTLVPAASKR